jgi:hypothetical protein
LEGNGLAVSVGRGVKVRVSVGVLEAVCVGVRAGTVFVGTLVAVAVGEIGVEVSVQASENITMRIKIRVLRLINGIFAPLGVIYLRNREAKRDLRSSKMPLAAGSAKIGLLANFPIQWENYKKIPVRERGHASVFVLPGIVLRLFPWRRVAIRFLLLPAMPLGA